MKRKRFERDVDECAFKIEEILSEYNCEIGVYDEDCTPTAKISIDVVDLDNKDYKELVEQ